jgi:hypothetical protein
MPYKYLKLVIFSLFFIFNTGIQGLCCGTCPGGTPNVSGGQLFSDTLNFLGINYNWTHSYSQLKSPFHDKIIREDAFYTHQMNLSGGFYLFKSLSLHALLPFFQTTQNSSVLDKDQIIRGLGNSQFLLSRRVLNLGTYWQQQLFIQGGIQLPALRKSTTTTGNNYNNSSNSFAVPFRAQYRLLHNNWQGELNSSYTFQLKNKAGYTYSNLWNTQLLLTHTFEAKQLQFLPSIGLNYLYLSPYKFKDRPRYNTRGHALFLQLIGNLILKEKIIIAAEVRLPFLQKINEANFSYRENIQLSFYHLI